MSNISPLVGKCFRLSAYAGKVCAVAKKKLPISRRDELRTLLLVIAVTVVPIAGTVFVVFASTQPNLSGLTPIGGPLENYSLLNWSSLARDRPSNKAVQVLGYMMDGEHPLRDGEWVQDFVLLPEAGNLLHPAHRFGDHMIAVHMENYSRIQFLSRSLVWVWGIFRESPGHPDGAEPLYSVERAGARPADKNDVGKYFK